jgi:hypothetical protein
VPVLLQRHFALQVVFIGGFMALDLSGVADGKLAVAAAGALVIGVVVAIRAIEWLRMVILVGNESRDAADRASRR